MTISNEALPACLLFSWVISFMEIFFMAYHDPLKEIIASVFLLQVIFIS